jgi:HlyD family secretion protein
MARRLIRPPLRILPAGVLMVALSGWSLTWFLSRNGGQDVIHLSGRLEGYEIDIGARYPGRVVSVAVREGDRVRKGQRLARQESDEAQAELSASKSRLLAARKVMGQTQQEIPLLESRIQESLLGIKQSAQEASARIFQAEAQLASAQAQLMEAQASLEKVRSDLWLAKVDHDRYAELASAGAIPRQRLDQAQASLAAGEAMINAHIAIVESYKRQVSSAQGQVSLARSTSLTPEMRSSQLSALRSQLTQAQFRLAASKAEVQTALADVKAAQVRLTDLDIHSPIDGVVLSRTAEPGAVVASGQTLLTLIPPDNVYLRGFIPEGSIGRVKVGQRANVFLDSFPGKPFIGRLSAVDSHASFTPENIYFKQDRVKQVFGVRISIDKPAGLAKPGMPADAEILIQPHEMPRQ